MPTYDKVLELAEVLKFDSDNTIKKVTLNVKTYDVAVGSNIYAVSPMVAVLSAEDYSNTSISKVSTANTAVDIALWGYEYAGGDTYYNDVINAANSAINQVASLLEFQGTSTVDITTLT